MDTDLAALAARYHRAFNDRDFDVWRDVFDEDVELLVDGVTFRGVDAAIGYGVGSVAQFPGLHIDAERIIATSGDTIVSEIDLVNGEAGQVRRQGTACEVCRVRDGRIVSCRSYYMAEGTEQEDAVRVPIRAEAARVAEEHASLRRVATLVARGASQDELFAAVTEEIGWLVGADPTSLMRFDSDDTLTLVAAWSARDSVFPIGATSALDEHLRSVRDTGRPWRWGPAQLPESGPFVAEARRLGIRSVVGVPILVDGQVWGTAFACSREARQLAEDAEGRIANFTELIGMAISNINGRAELAASRARIAAAADDERRRLVRDLHDGAQQRLVHTILTLKLAEQSMPDHAPGSDLVAEARGHAERATDELRELAHGILPSVLTAGGLRAAVEELASRMPMPIAQDVSVDRLPAPVEATAYFVVAEALTNVAKHAGAATARVLAGIDDGTLRVEVHDDGAGGARPDGSGLLGLVDRLAVHDGRLRVDSPPGDGTRVVAEIPLDGG